MMASVLGEPCSGKAGVAEETALLGGGDNRGLGRSWWKSKTEPGQEGGPGGSTPSPHHIRCAPQSTPRIPAPWDGRVGGLVSGQTGKMGIRTDRV